MKKETTVYRPINPKAEYMIWVTRLITAGRYRVTLFERYDAHDTESTDINLLNPADRRWLENYVERWSYNVKLYGVFFGNSDCGAANHYTLETYRLQNSCFPSMAFLNDIKLRFAK